MGFCQAVEGVRRRWVGGFVGVDEEGLCAVAFLDVGFSAAGLEIEDGVSVEAEGFEDAVYLGVLGKQLGRCLWWMKGEDVYFVELFRLALEVGEELFVVYLSVGHGSVEIVDDVDVLWIEWEGLRWMTKVVNGL